MAEAPINRQTMSTFGLPSGDGFRGKTSGTYRCHDGRYHSFHSRVLVVAPAESTPTGSVPTEVSVVVIAASVDW